MLRGISKDSPKPTSLKSTHLENKLIVTRVSKGWGGIDWDLVLTHVHTAVFKINNKYPLYSTGKLLYICSIFCGNLK